MTKEQYLTQLQTLGLKPASKITARYLGLTVRRIQDYASGVVPISTRTELLLELYRQHGLPPLAAIPASPPRSPKDSAKSNPAADSPEPHNRTRQVLKRLTQRP